MLRVPAICVLLALGVGVGLGAGEKPKPPRGDATLELVFPRTVDLTEDPECITKLVIDGKDLGMPPPTRHTVPVALAKGADSVKVAYTFWPNTYTKVTRTRVVKVEKGKTVKVDMRAADSKVPDSIRPIYVPTPEEVVEAMCKMAKIGKDDVVYDIGCGDGRLVITGVKKFGAKRGVGIDIDPDLVKTCQKNAKAAGVSDRVRFEAKDAQKIKDFSEATVVFLYLGTHLNLALRPTLEKTLKPGARIVSHRFKMGDWKPDSSKTIKAKDNYGFEDDFDLHLYTIKKKKD